MSLSSPSTQPRWNLVSLIFSGLAVAVFLLGLVLTTQDVIRHQMMAFLGMIVWSIPATAVGVIALVCAVVGQREASFRRTITIWGLLNVVAASLILVPVVESWVAMNPRDVSSSSRMLLSICMDLSLLSVPAAMLLAALAMIWTHHLRARTIRIAGIAVVGIPLASFLTTVLQA